MRVRRFCSQDLDSGAVQFAAHSPSATRTNQSASDSEDAPCKPGSPQSTDRTAGAETRCAPRDITAQIVRECQGFRCDLVFTFTADELAQSACRDAPTCGRGIVSSMCYCASDSNGPQ